MYRAVKNKRKLVTAYKVTEDSPFLKKLIQEGKIVQSDTPPWQYEVMSQEAETGESGKGQLVSIGDYIKLDSSGNPYPNGREFFEKNHRKIVGNRGEDQGEENLYEQIPELVQVWNVNEPPCEEIDYLIRNGKLVVHTDSEEKYYNAQLWGTMLSAPKDAAIVFYEICRDARGKIEKIDFNFVTREEFENSYTVCEGLS